MSPPISKDLWLAAAITSTTLPTALAQPTSTTSSAPPAPAGIVAAITPGAQIKSNDQILYVGSNALPGQRITTGKGEVLHVLMQDQSALTLGPESELVIDEFQYDESSRKGKIRLNLRQGLVRVVGGHISKNEATTITTPHGLVEISGGIAMVEATSRSTTGSYLFGQGMRATDNNGNTETITRAGFGVDISSEAGLDRPRRTTTQIGTLLNRLESPARAGGGVASPNPSPTPGFQLIGGTGNFGVTTDPSSTLANDRLKNVVDNNAATDSQRTLQTILAAGQTPNQS